MNRSTPNLIATGLVGGLDIGTGVLALLLVEHATGSALLGGLAFAVGFIALTFAKSELFTENFLLPVTAVAAGKGSIRGLLRLWGGTAVANLAAGWFVMLLVITGMPYLGDMANKLGAFYVDLVWTWQGFALAVIGGMAITLMTWMHQNVSQTSHRLVPSITTAWLLGAGSLNHAIVCSLLIFGGLHTGVSPFGYLDMLAALGFCVLGNTIGGVGLVTSARLLQLSDALRDLRAGR